MKVKKYALVLGAALLMLAGCKPAVNPVQPGNQENNPVIDTPVEEEGNLVTDILPSKSIGTRAKSLDFIFNNRTLGKTTLKIRRSEWKQMLKNFEYFYKNENLVKVENYTYEKDGETWNLENCGIRLRGNTSRYSPQGKDIPTDLTNHTKANAGWSEAYYAYAADCPDDDYRQAHFKIDFEPDDGQEQKMAGCMKGVALKRNDSSYARELLCYDVFRKNGIWTAPRASHTRVLFEFIEDIDEDGNRIEDISECSKTNVDFGVYEMFEEVNKQSLKARDKDEIEGQSIWKNGKGDLWKCAGGNLSDPNVSMYAENVVITGFDDEGNPTGWVWDSPTYDLKSNKDQVERASTYFKGFIQELKDLKNTEAGTTEGTAARKAFYEKWFDMDLFLKTYAINVMCGMDDDYWGNANNYYLYFDNDSKGTQKCYLIPFDYDNTLGNSIKGTGAENDVMNWGQGSDRPLMDRLLEVPEYRQMYINYLRFVSDYESKTSAWNIQRCKELVELWHDLVTPYYNSKDLKHDGRNTSPSALGVGDDGGYNASKYYLTHEPYYYVQMHNNIMAWTSELPKTITFNLNGGNIDGSTKDVTVNNPQIRKNLSDLISIPKRPGYVFLGWTTQKDKGSLVELNYETYVYAKWQSIASVTELTIVELEPGMEGYDEDYEGIQIQILNPPTLYNETTNKEGARVRYIFVNDVKVADVSNSSMVVATKWAFPYTETGKDYKVQVKYLKENYYTQHSISNSISIKATSGKGKFSLETDTVYFGVEDNVMSFSPKEPVIYVAGKRISADYKPGYFQMTFYNSSWSDSCYPSLNDYKLDDLNLFSLITSETLRSGSIYTQMRYIVYNNDGFGDYRLEINSSGNSFRLNDTRPKIEMETDTDDEHPGLFLKFPVENLPENTYIRRIWMNGRLVSDVRGYSKDSSLKIVLDDEWYYPFVVAGEEYRFRVDYFDSNWDKVYSLSETKVTPTSGRGELVVNTMPVYMVEDNVITWTTQPVMKIGSTVITEELFESDMYYNMNLNTTGWSWCAYKNAYAFEISSFDITSLLSTETEDGAANYNKAMSNTCFMSLSFMYGSNYNLSSFPYGEYVCEILNDSSKMNFTLK